MTERLIHFSMMPLTKIESVAQEQDDGEPFFKPRGLWFSVEGSGDGWKDWCEGNNFHLEALARQTEITFKPRARIKRIGTPEELDAFNEEYVVHYPALKLPRGMIVDWSKLAEEFDAIIVSPYQWQRRLSNYHLWYYTWDCASGCVWNAKAIKALRALPTALDRAAE